jgi:hypothetical protein
MDGEVGNVRGIDPRIQKKKFNEDQFGFMIWVDGAPGEAIVRTIVLVLGVVCQTKRRDSKEVLMFKSEEGR